MTYDEVIRHFGTGANAARALNTSRQRIFSWGLRRRVPLAAQVELEIATGGALRADLPPGVRRGYLRRERRA